MEKRLQIVSIAFFLVLMLTMLLVIGLDTPIPFDGLGKSLMLILVVSMIGTVVPLFIMRGRD